MKGYLAGLLLAAAAAWPGSGCKDENPELALGDSPSDVVFPASNVLYGQHVQRLFNQACALSGCHDDGAHHWFTTKFPIFNEDGTPRLVASVAIDITDHERAQAQVRELQKLAHQRERLEQR